MRLAAGSRWPGRRSGGAAWAARSSSRTSAGRSGLCISSAAMEKLMLFLLPRCGRCQIGGRKKPAAGGTPRAGGGGGWLLDGGQRGGGVDQAGAGGVGAPGDLGGGAVGAGDGARAGSQRHGGAGEYRFGLGGGERGIGLAEQGDHAGDVGRGHRGAAQEVVGGLALVDLVGADHPTAGAATSRSWPGSARLEKS